MTTEETFSKGKQNPLPTYLIYTNNFQFEETVFIITVLVKHFIHSY